MKSEKKKLKHFLGSGLDLQFGMIHTGYSDVGKKGKKGKKSIPQKAQPVRCRIPPYISRTYVTLVPYANGPWLRC